MDLQTCAIKFLNKASAQQLFWFIFDLAKFKQPKQ
jgi:hypothetical protein